MNDDRLGDFVETIDKLKVAIRGLESRVSSLENKEPQPHPVPRSLENTSPLPETASPGEFEFTPTSAPRVFSLLGRSILIMGGAFLLRALTDAGTIPPLAGFALGLLYALALFFLSDRTLRVGDRGAATALGFTAAIVAFPFLFETTIILKLVNPLTGGFILASISGIAIASAWRRNVRLLSWVYTMAALFTGMAMGFATGAPVFYATLLLVLGVVTMLMAYTRKWYLKRWVVALCADLVIYRLTVLVNNPPSVGSDQSSLSASAVQILALALGIVYLGMFTYRALAKGRGVKAFDVIQSVFVLVVGFIGAIRIGSSGIIGANILGWCTLVTAAGYYTVAFTVVHQKHGRGRGFFYFASLALIFLFIGSRTLAEGSWLAWCWIILGLVAAILGGKFDRLTLRAHSAVYLILASFQTGMFRTALDSYLGSPTSSWLALDTSGFVALLVMTGCYWILVISQRPLVLTPYLRLPRFFVAIMCLMGFSSLAIIFLVIIFTGTPPAASAPTVAVIRTGIMSIAILGLAFAGRRKSLMELGWLVYPLLALGLGKLLWEDLRSGNPMAMSISFALFGTALILAPRVLRSGKKR